MDDSVLSTIPREYATLISSCLNFSTLQQTHAKVVAACAHVPPKSGSITVVQPVCFCDPRGNHGTSRLTLPLQTCWPPVHSADKRDREVSMSLTKAPSALLRDGRTQLRTIWHTTRQSTEEVQRGQQHFRELQRRVTPSASFLWTKTPTREGASENLGAASNSCPGG